MVKYLSLIASIAIALTAATAARSDSDEMLIYLKLDDTLSKQVHFTVDGRYACDAKAHATDKNAPYTCVFASACLLYDETFMFHEGSDGTCKEVPLDSNPHTVVMTWARQKLTRQVKLAFTPSDPDFGPASYDNECTLSMNPGDTAPAFSCKSD